ncbi:HAD family hydrolase [Myxococcaceae bacterium GXIMD 01537]
MSIACVVVDFDGTFTDVAAEGAPFVSHFKKRLSEVLGRDVEPAWSEETAAVLAGAETFGWNVGGRIVAPATADPYLQSTCVAHRLLERFAVKGDAAARNDIVQTLYREAYTHSATAFKPEAKEVLEALLDARLPVYVVTNAHTDLVENKLTTLAPRGRERIKVFGDARKFLLEDISPAEPRFDAVPESMTAEGLPRPIYLRRGKYYEALRRIWKETGTSPERTLVAGDIFELDLALPAALGAHVQLVARDNVLPYEVNAVKSFGARGGVDRSLLALLPRLR